MILYRISLTIVLILIFSSIFHLNDSEHIVNEGEGKNQIKFDEHSIQSDSNFDSIKNKLIDEFEGRAGFGSAQLNAIDNVFGQFWHSLYINRGFNSSFVLLLPLFTITIPGYGRGLQNQTPLSALNIGNLAIFGILVFGTIALWSPILYPDFSFGSYGQKRALPLNDWESLTEIVAKSLLLLTEQIIGRALEVDDKELKVNNFLLSRIHSVVDFVMKFVDKLLDDLPEYPGLHPQQCIKRSICESYRRKDSYGNIGKALRFFFRPYGQTGKNTKTISKYRLAANYGIKDKSVHCEHRFNGCELNFIHLIHNMIHFLF